MLLHRGPSLFEPQNVIAPINFMFLCRKNVLFSNYKSIVMLPRKALSCASQRCEVRPPATVNR